MPFKTYDIAILLGYSFIATTKDLATQFDEIGTSSELAGHKISKMYIDEGVASFTLDDKPKHTPTYIRQKHEYAMRYYGRK